MARPRHYINHVGPGELGFFTTTALDFAHLFCREEMREAMTWLLLNHLLTSKATLHAFVVMKHHIHFVARMPQTQHGNEFVQELKRSSALTLKPLLLPEEVDQLKQQTGLNRHTFWKRSYRSVPIYTEALLEQKIAYTHANPVKKEYVDNARDYRWSSAWALEREDLVGENYQLRLEPLRNEFKPPPTSMPQ
ncbi:MAG: transposase [Fimbriimonas sp.]